MSQGVPKTRAEVKDLHRLRQLFLEAPNQKGLADYWSDSALLELYDATYARRIAWKWAAVLTELEEREWTPAAGIRRWIDWGCGSGVASEMMLQHFPSSAPNELIVSDRSTIARQYATTKLSALNSKLKVTPQTPESLNISTNDLLLISHVATELKEEQLSSLIAAIRKAGAVIWVEPGTPFCSEKLITARAALSEEFEIAAPCPHSLNCPLENKTGDWCHFFAPPPQDVFHDPLWARLSKELNIDLRSLPVSFLVLQDKSAPVSAAERNQTNDRLLARPRYYKGYAKVMVCTADGELTNPQLQANKYKREFKQWEKDCFYVELTNAQDSD